MAFDAMPDTGTVHLDLSGTDVPAMVGALFQQQAGSLEALFDARLVVGPAVDGEPCWVVEPRAVGDPIAVEWDPERLRLVTSANGAREVFESTLLLGRLARSESHHVVWSVPETVDEAVDVLLDALANDAAYWHLAAESWPIVRDRALTRRPTDWDEFRTWAEELLAHLPDGHARIADTRHAGFYPPYPARLDDDRVVLARVPEGSPAHSAGVRPGWSIKVPDAAYWWRTTPASPQGRPWRAARRFLRGVGDERDFTATSPDGQNATWTERRGEAAHSEAITVSRTASGAMLVRLASFATDPEIPQVMDRLCRDADPQDHMILDLRGNPGGSVLVADALMRRFLRHRCLLGSVTYSNARGGFGAPVERWAEPSEGPCWPGRLTILVDVHTLSAAEVFTTNLQGLPAVSVLGEVTGGGIGMQCHVPLGNGLEAWFASAIRYDREGNPVDVRGIQPDGPLVEDPAAF